jgi:hypothetical protein
LAGARRDTTKRETENRSAAGVGLDRDLPAMGLDDGARNRYLRQHRAPLLAVWGKNDPQPSTGHGGSESHIDGVFFQTGTATSLTRRWPLWCRSVRRAGSPAQRATALRSHKLRFSRFLPQPHRACVLLVVDRSRLQRLDPDECSAVIVADP